MVTVAVAGGAGNVGRSIVDALKESPNHKVIVLSRKVSSRQNIGPEYFYNFLPKVFIGI